MTLLIIGVLAVLAYGPIVVFLKRDDRRERAQYEPAHASRPANPPQRHGKARVWRRAAPSARRHPGTTDTSRPAVTPGRARGAPGLSAARRLVARRARPGTTIHHEPGLGQEDAATLDWLRSMRGLRHPGWTMLALHARLAVLHMITMAPTRGDAQGRAVRVCAPESRPAARADMTGSLSPHHEERPGPVSAPPDPGTMSPGQPDSQIENGGQHAGLAGRAGSNLPPVAGPGTSPAAAGEVAADGHTGTRLLSKEQLPAAVTDALAAVERIAAELAIPSDEERWPHLARPWADDTGSFTAIALDGA